MHKKKPEYTLQRISNSGKLYGSVHGSNDGAYTLCGHPCDDEKWYVHTNNYDGVVTCKKCRKATT